MEVNLSGKMMKIEVVHNQIQGDRDYQQDSLAQRDIGEFKLLVLADGMGGYNGGEIASKIVVDTFMTHPFSNSNEFLEEALDSANKKISEYKEGNPDVSNMGTTVIAVLMNSSFYQWLSVGDSPLYLVRDNMIRRINENHSVAGMLNLEVERGEISLEQAQANKNRHMLTSAILGEEIFMKDISTLHDFKMDDKLILASDGIETLRENDILNIINSNPDSMIASEKVLKEIETKDKKYQDNASIIIATPLLDKLEQSEGKKTKSTIISKMFLFFIVLLILFFIMEIN